MEIVKVADSKFLTKYVNRMVKAITDSYPDYSKDIVRKIVVQEVEQKLMDPRVSVVNSYTNERKESTLLSSMEYVMERKPVIAANATFFKQHAEGINANAYMLDTFDRMRGVYKKKMFVAQVNNQKAEYNISNIDQLNMKKLSNSWYGGSAMPSSPFYNKECAAATTKTARSVISTCMCTFESVFADTFTFVDSGEFFYWCNTVIKEEYDVDDWVKRVNYEQAFDRLFHRIITKEENDEEIVLNYLKNLDTDTLTRLYWKYNLIEFTDNHPEVKTMHELIYGAIEPLELMKSRDDLDVVPDKFKDKVKGSDDPMKTWEKIRSHELFYDPNSAPDSIKDDIAKLSDIYVKYVYVDFLFTDRMYKLKNFRRNIVTVIDTDSNILSLDPWIEYVQKNLMHGNYGRSDLDNTFININIVTYVISAVVKKILDFYGRMSNIDDDHRFRFQMKNEFFFCRLILANVKKRYLNKMLLREGNYLTKPTYAIMGFDFKKSSTADEASKFFYSLCYEELLDSETINIPMILRKLKWFRGVVRESLEKGEIKYLPVANPKELEAYDHPEREQSVRGMFAWNALYPENAITPPQKIVLLKTTLYSAKDLEKIKYDYPVIYNNAIDKIFNDTTGMFVKIGSSGEGEEKVEGLSVFGIPQTESIPEWIIPFIDYTSVVNAVMAPFKSVTETFGIPSIEEGPSSRRTTGFSTIVRF